LKTKQNWLDVFWTLTKRDSMTDSAEYGAATLRDFLDRTQYTDTGIGAYEWIFGTGFISPGRDGKEKGEGVCYCRRSRRESQVLEEISSFEWRKEDVGYWSRDWRQCEAGSSC
jgi:hypothetical protein